MKITEANPLILIGAGKMGGALLAGWLEHGVEPRSIVVSDPNVSEDIMSEFLDRGIRFIESNNSELHPTALLFAVKPQIMAEVLKQNARFVKPETLVISIAAGTPIVAFESAFGEIPVIRAMPNTPAQVQRGITAVFGNGRILDAHKDLAETLLKAVGQVVWLNNESQIDLATAISGSGPAYVFHLTECLAEAAREVGLPAEVAEELAMHTVSGAGELMSKSNLQPEELRRNVTSPGGTTEAALKVLMASDGMQDLMVRAVKEAVTRANELGKT